MRRSNVLGWVVLVLTALLAVPAALLHTDNGMDDWLPVDDAARTRYDEFRDTFGSDHFAVVASMDRDEVELVEDLLVLSDRLRALPDVERVLVPVTFTPAGVPVLAAADGLQEPLIAHSEHGACGAAFVGLVDGLDADRRGRVLDRIETVAALSPRGDWSVAGPASINRALDRHSQRSFAVLVPIAATGVLIVLIVGLAHVRAALVVLATSGLACGATLGTVQLTGRPLHMLLSILPALLIVLGTAYALHPVTRFLDDPIVPDEALSARWRRVLSETLRPACVAAATTAAGLGSLTLSDLAPVQDLGRYGALGILLAFLLAYTVVPAALLALRILPYGPRTTGSQSSLPERAAALARRRGPAIVSVSAVLLALAVVGVAQLPVESNVLRLLPADSPVRAATARIENRMFGLTPIELWIGGPSDRLLDEDVVVAVGELAADLRGLPLVTHVLSPYDALGTELVPSDTPLDELAAATPSHVRDDGGTAALRVTLCTETVGIEESDALVRQVSARSAGALPPGTTAVVTGAIPLLVHVQQALVSSQIRSFVGAFVVVTLVLLIDLGSVPLALLSLVPNVAPALVAAGVMGWVGAPLDAATVAVAGLALGLAVDDTVHVLHRYRRTGGELEAVFRTTARPIAFTTLAAVVGFGAFVASDFPPARRLGLLIAGAAITAVAADLLLLPALLSRFGRARWGRLRPVPELPLPTTRTRA